MRGAAHEGTSLQGELDESGLEYFSQRTLTVASQLTSTSSKIATTKTSKTEFLHPTTTPGRSDLVMSAGQKMRISPSCPGMTCDGLMGRALEGSAAP